MDTSVRSTTKTRPYCRHCGKFVSYSTFHRHRELYYNKEQKVWTTKRKQEDKDETGCVETIPEQDLSRRQEDVMDRQSDEIEDVLKQADFLMSHLENRNLQTTEEYLTKCLLRLDAITPVSEEIRRRRRNAVKHIQVYLARIDESIKTASRGGDSSTSDDSDSSSTDTESSDSNTDSSEDDSNLTEDWSEDESAFVEKLIGSKTEELENRHKLGLTNSGVTAKLSNLVSWLCFLLYIWKCTNMISDNAFGVLLGFIYKVFSLISNDDKVLASVIMLFPTSVYCIRKFMNINRDEFERFVVCPSCTKIYLLKDCFQNQSCRIPKLTHCNQKHYRTKSSYKVCNEPLFRRVSLRNGQHASYPYKIYCYSYISTRLESLLQRKGYEDMCSKWKKRESRSDLMFDVYDGEVWKSFQNFKGTAFLAADNTYGLQLNVDWFQPYTRRNDISVGVIYMVLLNLPLSVRFKKENMIIVGVIPSLSKEPSCLNNFLDPMVDELKRLWKGVSMSTSKYPHGVQVRCAVVCFAADVPAARKLCGFMGHSAARGCSKCLKVFPGGFGEKTNYSGFNKQLWPLRLYDCHVTAVRQINNCYSKTARAKKESELGWRYTSLMKLEYFNSVTHHVIDPMHNLFLGTAKRMFKLWIDNCILTQDNLAEIDRKIRNFKLGGDMGRLPSNIASNWGGFTAEQWKNWTLIYSLYVLNGILPDRHYKCWHTFVTACLKLVSPIVRMTDARIADHLFIKFGTEVESLYGKTVITPNMHLHCHLYESVLNYGPVYTFWLFAFERYNGILGDFNTNRRDNIEIQLMREFLTTVTLLDRCFGLKQDVHSDILLPIALDVSSTHILIVHCPPPPPYATYIPSRCSECLNTETKLG